MKAAVIIIFLFLLQFFSGTAYTQNSWIDSITKAVATQKEDTNKVWAIISMSGYYSFNNPDSGVIVAKQALALAE